jgi:hypothetical protein
MPTWTDMSKKCVYLCRSALVIEKQAQSILPRAGMPGPPVEKKKWWCFCGMYLGWNAVAGREPGRKYASK